VGQFSGELELSDLEAQDILDDGIYSIQEAKILAEEDFKKKEAEKKKEKIRQLINQQVVSFQELYKKN